MFEKGGTRQKNVFHAIRDRTSALIEHPGHNYQQVMNSSAMRQRVRACFQKTGDLRYLGHRDLVRTFERLFRRMGFMLSMSEGFHPKAKFSFPLALATGIQGEQEVMEVEFNEPIDANQLLGQLNQESPEGLSFTSVELLESGAPKLQPQAVEYRIDLPAEVQPRTQSNIDELLSRDTFEITRPGRKQPIDVVADLEGLEIDNDELCIRQRITRQAGFQPREILEILELADLESQGQHLRRTCIVWENHTAPVAR